MPETTLYNTLSKLVKNNKNLTNEGGYYSYAFFTNKNGVTVSVHLYPESGGSGGDFKMSWRRKNPVPGKSSEGAPALWVGKFKNGGEVFTTKDTVVSIDKNGKIDSGLITLLSKFWPDYKG